MASRLLTEQEAFAVASSLDRLPQDQRASAEQALKAYKANQEDRGLSYFPQADRQRMEDEQQFRSVFTDSVDRVFDVAPGLRESLKFSPDPQKDKHIAANTLFLSRSLRMPPADVSNNYRSLLSQYSRAAWGEPISDDGAFFSRAQQDVKKIVDDSNSTQQAMVDATKAALAEGSFIDKFKGWRAGDKTKKSTAYIKAYGDTLDRVLPYKDVIDNMVTALGATMDNTTEAVRGADMVNQVIVNRLLDIPNKDRALVIGAIFAEAEKRGKEKDTSWQFTKQLGESFARTVGGALEGSGNMLAENAINDVRNHVGTGEAEVPQEMSVIDTPEKAAEYVRMASSVAAIRRGGLASMGGAIRPPDMGQRRALSEEEQALLNKAVNRQEKSLSIARMVRQAAMSTDPITNVFSSAIGSSAAAMPFIAMGFGGGAILAQGYAGMEYDQLRLQYPDMSPQQAAGISVASGVVQAGLDRLEFNFLRGRLPSFSNLIEKGVMSSVLKRSGIRFAEGMAFENLQEGLQDISTPVVHELATKLSADVPSVKWQEEWESWYSQRADIAIGVLPLVLLGTGTGTLNDVLGADKMLRSDRLLGQLGVTEEYRRRVTSAMEQGDAKGALQALQESMVRRDRNVAAQFAGEPTEAAKLFDDLVNGAGRNGPRFTRGADGWTVTTPDGNSTNVSTWEEARAVAVQAGHEVLVQDIDEVAKLADHFVSQDTGIAETVNITGLNRSLQQDVEDKVITEEQARERAIIAGQMLGLTEEQSLKEAWAVLGRNTTDTQQAVAESATDLFNGANVTTVVEDVVEGRWKAGLANGTYTKAQAFAWIKLAEDATGESFLKSDTDAGITEALSAIVVADVIGRRKEGGMPAGVVTKGLVRAIDAASTDHTRFAAFLSSFRQFFRQVFSRARALSKARKEGRLGKDYQSFLDSLLGTPEQVRQQNAAATEAQNMADGGANVGAADQPAQTKDIAIGSFVRYGEYTGRLGKEGERYTITTPDRVVELTANDMVDVVSEEDPDVTRKLLMDELAATDVQVGFNPVPIPGQLAIDIGGTRYVPQNRKLSKNVVNVNGSPAFRVLDPARGRITLLHGEQATKAMDAFLAAAATIEQQGGKVSYAIAPAKYSEQLQQQLAAMLDKNPDKRRAFYEEIQKRFAKLANEVDLLGANNARPFELRRQARKRADIREYELRKEYPAGHVFTEAENKLIEKKAKQEANEWLKPKLDEVPSDKERILGFLKVYNAALMGLPAKMRGDVGGFMPVANAPTSARALEILKGKIKKVGEVVEKALVKEYTSLINDLFKTGLPRRTSGEAPKSNVDAETSSLFELAKAASKWDEAMILKEVGWREKVLNDTTNPPTMEVADRLTQEIDIIELVGALSTADASRLAAVHFSLNYMLIHGRTERENYLNAQRARIKQFTDDFIAATNVTDVHQAQAEQDKRKGTISDTLRNVMLNIGSFNDLIYYIAGESDVAKRILDLDRKTDQDYEELNETTEQSIVDLFTTMVGGSELAGHKLQYELGVKKNVKAPDGTMLTQMEAVHAVMTWNQPDGRRHMEGKFDDDGNKLTSWAYTQAWVDSVESQLSVEAKEVMAWLYDNYRSNFPTYDAFYRTRFGVALPFNAMYSPLVVEPGKASAGEMIDPSSGLPISNVALSPPGLKTRSTNSVARPVFKNALQLYAARTKQMNMWVSRYDFIKVMQGMFLSRDTLEYVRAVAGDTGVRQMLLWVRAHTAGALREAASGLELNSILSTWVNNAASAAILGRVSTLMVQMTTLGAAAARMPAGDFVRLSAKLYAGKLGWTQAFNSPFIQRRVIQKSPLVREMMKSLSRARKPNAIKVQQRRLANLLASTDGFGTAATYTLIYNYQLEQASKTMAKADAEAWAANEAERITEEVSQPVRQSTRSLLELQASTNWWARLGWAFSSEPRQKLAMQLFALNQTIRGQKGMANLARTAFVVFGVNGLFVHLVKTGWASLRGKDDEDMWSWQNLLVGALTSPMTGFPAAQALGETGTLLSGPQRSAGAWKRMLEGESFTDTDTLLKDAELMLTGVAPFSDTAATMDSYLHLLRDAYKLVDTAAGD